MPDRWDFYNETISSIISQARRLTPTEIMSVRSQLIDLCNNKKRMKKTQFNHDERIKLIHPELLRGKILIYLLKKTKWGNNPLMFTRKKLAEVTGKKQSQISTATRKLISLGLVSMHREFFQETRKFRNVYNITTNGVYAVKWLMKTKKGKGDERWLIKKKSKK